MSVLARRNWRERERKKPCLLETLRNLIVSHKQGVVCGVTNIIIMFALLSCFVLLRGDCREILPCPLDIKNYLKVKKSYSERVMRVIIMV